MDYTITPPIISGFTAAILGIIQIYLMMAVGLMRRNQKILLGDGGSETLNYKIRRHGNLTENAPIFLILLTLLEITGGAQNILVSFAVIFTVARLSHAYALSDPDKPMAPRAIGALGTSIGIMGTAGTLIWQLLTVQ